MSKTWEYNTDCCRASKDYVLGSNYAGSHWLASFLMLALQTREETQTLLGNYL